MPLLIATKLGPEVHDAIACAMLAMQLLTEKGVVSNLLTGGSDWIWPKS